MLTPVTMHKSEKYHIRRMSDDSRELVMKNFGCKRKVYNLYVNDYFSRLEACGYENGDDIPKYKLPQVSSFKKEYPYLKEVDSLGLANAKIAFESALKRFRENCDHTSYTKRALRRSRSGTEALSFRGLVGLLSSQKQRATSLIRQTASIQMRAISLSSRLSVLMDACFIFRNTKMTLSWTFTARFLMVQSLETSLSVWTPQV